MNKFEFRAWTKDAEYMLCHRELMNQWEDLDDYSIFTDPNLIVMQWTGRTAMSVKIFDGDYISFDHEYNGKVGFIAVVEYFEGAYIVDDFLNLITCENIKVLGNIYEDYETYKNHDFDMRYPIR